MRYPWLAACLALAAAVRAQAPRPDRFGPYILNALSSTYSPFGYDRTLTNGTYRLQIGWVEPLGPGPGSPFQGAYLEADGNMDVSPFQGDVGTTFAFRPIRWLELGLSYNRLLYFNSLVGFTAPDAALTPPPPARWAPDSILVPPYGEPGGADVFTFQATLSYALSRLGLSASASRALWDVDAPHRDFVYEYGSDLLIRKLDHVDYALLRATFDLRPLAFTKLLLKDQYWRTGHTALSKNLVSAGIAGFRLGRNSANQTRGLDLTLGAWTENPQYPRIRWPECLVVEADWTWDIRFLGL